MSVRLRGIRVAILCFAVLMLGNALAANAVQVNTLSTPQEEAPGAFVTHVFSVTNDTANPHDYTIVYTLPTGWGTVSAPTLVPLEPGQESTFFVTITIAAAAPAGTYDVTVTAAAEDVPSDAASTAAPVTVTPVNDFELVVPNGGHASPGGRIRYDVLVVNRGNAQDSYAIEALSSSDFPTTLSADAFDLAPQERMTIEIQLDVPAEADAGRDTLTVTVASTLYEELESDGVIFTRILPPGPESVGGMLMEELPARIRLSLDKDVLDGDFSSRLTFSASGQVKGGYFSASFSASDPLGADKPELGSFSILYRREPITYSIGDVSQGLTDLIRLSCRGGSVDVDEEYYDLRFIGGGRNDETRFAGYLGLGPERANVGFAYYGIRDTGMNYASIWSGTAFAEPLEDWTLRLEGALGIDNGLTSRAFLFGTTIDVSGYFLDAEVFSIGTFFPGSRADTAGIEISQRLRLSALSLSVSLEHVWDNVIGDPLILTAIHDEMGFNLRTTPMEDGPTLSMTADFEWDRYDDPALMNGINTMLAVNMSETSGVFPYAFSSKISDQIDNVTGTHLRTSTFSQGAGLSTDSFYVFLELSQEKREDVIAETTLSSSSDVSLRFRPEGALHEASITLGNSADSFDLSASLFIRFVENLDITFDGSISWDRADSSNVSFGWGITFSANVGIPMPFLVTKARIEGRAFIDRDLDGRYSIADVPAGDIVIAADQTEVSTNDEGVFRFPPLYPETYTISVSELPLTAAAPPPIEIILAAEETRWIEIPLTPVVVLTGRVFEDVNRDGLATDDETGFGQVRVLLRDEIGLSFESITDLTGAYLFQNVLPGRYIVSVDRSTLPDRFEFTTAPESPIEVGYDELPSVAFGGYVRPREVIVTFQPPTAEFDVSPASPLAGESVSFDGTLSFDFDGEIIAYVWDFDGDGETDATDATTEHTYASAGTYAVSLTVVDNGGNADTLTIDIMVAPPADLGVSTLFPPIADFSYSPSAPSIGSPVMFDGTLSSDFDGEIATYAWDFDGDLVPDAVSAIAEHSFSSSGTYPVSLTVTDNGGNSDTISYTVQVTGGADETPTEPLDEPEPEDAEPADDETQATQPQLPIAAFVYDPLEPEPGTPIRFNGTASLDPGGMIVAFAWDFDADGEIDSMEAIAEYTYDEPGTYQVTLAVADNEENANAITRSVVVAQQALPQPETDLYPPIAEFGYSPAEPQTGVPVLFNGAASTDLEGTIAGYAWDFDADLVVDATGAIAEHSFPSAGIHPVSLTVTDNAGNSDTATLDIHVAATAAAPPVAEEPLQPPIADYSYQPPSPLPGVLVTFDGSLSTDADGLIVSYTWDFAGDVQTPSESPFAQYVFADEGNYSVSLTVTDDDGVSDTATYLIDVGEQAPDLPPPPTTFQPPVADYSYMPAAPLAGEIVLFNGMLSFDFDGVVVSYAWDFNGDSSVDSVDAIAEYVFPAPGLYNVSLRVMDDSGISDTITYPITIE